MPNAALTQAMDRDAYEADAFDQWLAGHGMAWQMAERGEYGYSLDDLQLRFVCEDPVRWARAFLTEPDTGEPYSFWGYQEDSARSWRQDVIHQDGAEVGKTREITVLILWGQCTCMGFTTRNPSMLIGAPQQTHLDEIIMAIEAQVGVGEGASGAPPLIQSFWLKPKKHPHYLMRFKGPLTTRNGHGAVYFRPAGHDGEAFRGVHVADLAMYDEAAKTKDKVCWSEFHRAMKPGCRRRIYSVPDGDNSTEYYRMTQQAVPDLAEGQEGLRLFHWPKTLMPAPFWSAERDRHFVRLYGSRTAPGYVRNVLGEHGQQENPVWDWATIAANIRDLPDYRAIKLTVDRANDSLAVEVYRVELRQDGGRKHGQEHHLADMALDLAPFEDPASRRDAVRKLLRDYIASHGAGVYWAGADLGYAKDPTEIFLHQEVGDQLRDLVRIHAKGVSYDIQADLIYCLDELFGFAPGWGVDFGSAGTAVVQNLQKLDEYADGHYDERLVGFQFASALDAVDEDGDVLTEPDPKTGADKAVRLPAKELATNLMTARLQRYGYAWAYDTDVINHHSNHTAREGARHRIFSKTDDHTIDARRVALLRKVFDEQAGGVDVFSSGAYRRSA